LQDLFITFEASDNPVQVKPVFAGDLVKETSSFADALLRFCKLQGFEGKAGTALIADDEVAGAPVVLLGLTKDDKTDPFAVGAALAGLPAADYALPAGLPDLPAILLGFGLSAYRFARYKKALKKGIRLVLPDGETAERIAPVLEGVFLTRDLINIPANDMGPEELATAVRDLFDRHGGTGTIIAGDDLIDAGFPMVHAVGRASSRVPRLADFSWGDENAPKVTLVGKGVIFDSGGLNIKPSGSMLLMKKDMGGAANVLGLAAMIMAAQVPVRLRVIIPCVENAIAGNAFRPGDVLPSRKGLTVEIGNTDAEGRLVLADALTLADAEEPDLLIDMATLTGAARVALGPDLPPFFTKDDDLADDVSLMGEAANDPVWRLPLWQPYMSYLDSKIADINHINTSGAGFAGSITAALFLSRFVENTQSWVHFDIYGWTPMEKPGRPVGGDAQGIRALFDVICDRFGGTQ